MHAMDQPTLPLKKRQRENSCEETTIPKKKQKLHWEDRYAIWLQTKASESNDPTSLSNESLAFLVSYGIPHIKQSVADDLFKSDEIDPAFIARLLCTKHKPTLLTFHAFPPILQYNQQNQPVIRCPHYPYCGDPRCITDAKNGAVHHRNQRLEGPLLHTWRYVETRCRRRKPHYYGRPNYGRPMFLLETESGDLVTGHTNKGVYQWNVGKQFAENKALLAGELSLEEILCIKHMQNTTDSIGKEKEELYPEMQKLASQREKWVTELPRKMRLILKEKLEQRVHE